MPKRIVVTGGLTGGHVMPCITLALELQRLRWDVTYLGARGELEEAMAERYSIPFIGFRYARHPRAKRLASQFGGFVWALSILRRLRPGGIFSKGSQISVPVLFAASFLRIPIIVHESDVRPGSDTLLAQHLAKIVCLGFPAAATRISAPTIVTGNLTRPRFAHGDSTLARRLFDLNADKPLLFITGGSQGATTLNEMVFEIVPDLTSRYSVIHQCGTGKTRPTIRAQDYYACEFLHDELRHVYAAADLIVARAGATTITEVTRYCVPAIYVPYPWAEDDHQFWNALHSASSDVCTVIRQSELNPQRLLATIDVMMASRDAYRRRYASIRHPDTLGILTDLIDRYCRI